MQSVALLLGLLCVACQTSGETYFSVTGDIQAEVAGDSLCRLSLYEEDKDTELDWREVGTRIEAGFVLPTANRRYIFKLK